jgi:hypothetical protein
MTRPKIHTKPVIRQAPRRGAKKDEALRKRRKSDPTRSWEKLLIDLKQKPELINDLIQSAAPMTDSQAL